MNVEEFTRAACPPLLGVMPFHEGAVDHECERFNQAVVAEIERLAHAGLKGVVHRRTLAGVSRAPEP